MGYNFMFSAFPIIFGIVFFIVISVFIMVFVKAIQKKAYNNSQPKLTVEAKVVAKRIKVSGGGHAGANHHSSSSTYYYATFEFESSDRQELDIDDYEYGMLVEGDVGKLTFQGTKFLGFERNTVL